MHVEKCKTVLKSKETAFSFRTVRNFVETQTQCATWFVRTKDLKKVRKKNCKKKPQKFLPGRHESNLENIEPLTTWLKSQIPIFANILTDQNLLDLTRKKNLICSEIREN